MNLPARILKIFGWSVHVSVPDYPKLIICVAPHTSNWDFVLCELAIHSVGRTAGFMMKSSWFFFPLGCLFRAMGGVPVERGKKKGSLVEAMVRRFDSEPRLTLAIAPEGTRKRTANWHSGFLRIADAAHVPVALATIDGPTKTIELTTMFDPSGDIDADMERIKKFYSRFHGLKPDKFSTGQR